MSIMTGAHADDTTTMSREGLLTDAEKKSIVGGIALTCEDKSKSSKKQVEDLEESEEQQAMPDALRATGGRESEAEGQGIIDQDDADRLVSTRKTCDESDAVHVEGPVGTETPKTLTCNTLPEEGSIADTSERTQSNFPRGNSADRLLASEVTKEKVKPGPCKDGNEGCEAADIVDSLTEDLQEIHWHASERKLGPPGPFGPLGPDPSREDPEGKAAQEAMDKLADPTSLLTFHEAVRAGDDKCVAALLASGAVENLNEPDWNVSGDPPLLVAASNHCLPVLSLLLANGCEPGVRSPRGESALHRAILNGASAGMVLELVEELLKYGCPASVKEAGGGLTALHVLTRQLANAQASKNLHRNFDAALKALQLLAKAGPINAKDHQGRSALHILASSTTFVDSSQTREMESMLESFLTAGADPALKNDRGETPLHESLECGALSTAFLLIPHTPTGLTSRYGETPLHIASRKNFVDVVAKLLERGEDPSIQDAGGNTPLHLASARGFHQTVSLLVISPLAQLEKFNTDGLTALQVAAESGFVNTVKLLLKAGADPSQTVHYCATTLHRHPDISVLIDHELTRRRQLAA